MAVRLADRTEDRDNNFNLIRFLAAAMVLWGHSYPLSGAAAEPLWGGRSLGYIAVDIFFVTSGLLVTRSLLARTSLLGFAWARIVRIYPALIVAVMFCAFPVGLAFTSLPSGAFLSDSETWRFVGINSTLLAKRVVYELPGVFEHNPYPGAVNGSLWTLPWELRMYALLGGVGLLAWILARGPRASELRARCIALGVIGFALVFTLLNFRHLWTDWGAYDRKLEGLRLGAMFFLGGTYYLLRRFVWLHSAAFLAIGVLLWVSRDHSAMLSVWYTLGLGYLVLYLAYVPGGWIRQYNRVGDYSYGLYIYAFPVQQAVMATEPSLGVLGLFLWAGTLTLGLAILSWHFLERPALQQKDLYRRWLPGRAGSGEVSNSP